MCVAALAFSAHPRWLLVAIGNRDEYHDRPARGLHRWADDGPGQGIVAGRDLLGGGTWLGVSDTGRFALVTNLRGYGERAPGRASRGALVLDWLSGQGRYRNPQPAQLSEFNPFNLLLADRNRAAFLTNRPDPLRTDLAHGLYGLSNGSLDEPWPKTLQLKAALLDWLNRDGERLEPLFSVLASERLPGIGLHPREPSDVPREPMDTPPFIRDPLYGTRCSTVVAIAHDGDGTIAERRFDPGGGVVGETSIDFRWGRAAGA